MGSNFRTLRYIVIFTLLSSYVLAGFMFRQTMTYQRLKERVDRCEERIGTLEKELEHREARSEDRDRRPRGYQRESVRK